MAIIFAMLALGLHRVFITNINWDEFYFLSHVHLYLSGSLKAPLQTLHVHLYGWLPLVSDNEIHQIIAARISVWVISLFSCWLIYDIARNFCSREAALFPVLFYLGFSYVMDHGLSFRADPFCAVLFLGALHLLTTPERTRLRVMISACLMAIAFMLSVKTVFYMATIGPILLLQLWYAPAKKQSLAELLVFGTVFSVFLLLLYQFHSSTLPGASATEAGSSMMSAGNKTLFSGELFPRAHYIGRVIAENPFVWTFIVLGLMKAAFDALKGNDRRRALTALALALPLLSLIFYRNAFPYFFVFLMPAAIILSGLPVSMMIARSRGPAAVIPVVIMGAIALLVAASFVNHYARKLPDQTIAQTEIVNAVHRMFPEPVPYIDRNSMIASFPKVGFFMSGWGMENYRDENIPVMEDLIRQKQPKFLIVNHCALDISSPLGTRRACRHNLLAQDYEALRANFIHHWGPLYVAGKSFRLQSAAASQRFDVLVPGTYTLEANAAVAIDGVIHAPRATIRLSEGVHSISATGTSTQATLRLGRNLPRPGHAPSSQDIYLKF